MATALEICRLLIDEHARLNPIEQQPVISPFIAMAAIQQALGERGMLVDLQVRQVRLRHGVASFTNCVVLVVEGQVLGLHGAHGWEAAGRVGADIQAAYGWCGDFDGLGNIEEEWPSGKRLDLAPEDRAMFEPWLLRCRALVEHAVLGQAMPHQPAPSQPGRRL